MQDNSGIAAPSAASWQQMMGMIQGYQVTQVVRAAATFSIADHLLGGNDTAASIAAAESIDPDATRRLLRACASLGLTTTEDGIHYTATDLLLTLRKGAPGSLRGLATSQAASGHWLPWGLFTDAIRTGQNQTVNAYGTEFWSFLEEHPEERTDFTVAMDDLSAVVVGEAQRLIDTTGVKLAVDVGGASGSLVHGLMARNPDLHGAVLERADVVLDAAAAAEKLGLASRFVSITGDFFDSVPAADLYLLKFVLHDWDDDACVRILRNCRHALMPGGRVVVLETLVPSSGFAELMDMNMLTLTNGRERDLTEFDRILRAAGLSRSAVTPTESPLAIIEALPVD